MTTKALQEQLAAIEHERWADWQAWCHKILRENCPSPELEKVLERWDRQIATKYDDLSTAEQASDMEQVDRYWPLIEAVIAEAERAARIAQTEKLLDMDVPASYKQDGKKWQGLAVPRNLIRAELAQLRGEEK